MKDLREVAMEEIIKIVWQRGLNVQKNKNKTTETIRREVAIANVEIEVTGVIIEVVVVVAEEGEEVLIMTDRAKMMTHNTLVSAQKDTSPRRRMTRKKMMPGLSVNTSHLNTK